MKELMNSRSIFKYSFVVTMSLALLFCPSVSTEAYGENEKLTEEKVIVRGDTKVIRLPKVDNTTQSFKSTYRLKKNTAYKPTGISSTIKKYIILCSLAFYD